MRVCFPSIALMAVALASGCGDGDYSGYGQNEIVFGISQRTTASGTREVTGGYEYLHLARKGGWAPDVFRDGDGEGTCYFERFEDRLGRPHVESGAATFAGGKLPPLGLQILANQPEDSKHDGVGWGDGDVLTFDVSGFAMPRIPSASMFAPREALDVKAITPTPAAGAAGLSIKASDDVSVTWEPIGDSPPSRVMVSLETDEENGAGGQVRCFSSAVSGSAIIPSAWVARLFSAVDPAVSIKGHLAIASHRQVTILGRGSWIVYVVATTVHREQAFAGVR
jgi:hypothetical protein